MTHHLSDTLPLRVVSTSSDESSRLIGTKGGEYPTSTSIASSWPPKAVGAAYARASALSTAEAYRMLSRLSDSGLVRVAELEEVFESARDWLGLAYLLRAGYAVEGANAIHITALGRAALEEFEHRFPAVARA